MDTSISCSSDRSSASTWFSEAFFWAECGFIITITPSDKIYLFPSTISTKNVRIPVPIIYSYLILEEQPPPTFPNYYWKNENKVLVSCLFSCLVWPTFGNNKEQIKRKWAVFRQILISNEDSNPKENYLFRCPDRTHHKLGKKHWIFKINKFHFHYILMSFSSIVCFKEHIFMKWYNWNHIIIFIWMLS
jgi:hypothetical protein